MSSQALPFLQLTFRDNAYPPWGISYHLPVIRCIRARAARPLQVQTSRHTGKRPEADVPVYFCVSKVLTLLVSEHCSRKCSPQQDTAVRRDQLPAM